MKTKTVFILALGIMAAPQITASAQERKPTQGVAYYSIQRPLFPPWPVNPFPDLPVYEVKRGQFVYDDTPWITKHLKRRPSLVRNS